MYRVFTIYTQERTRYKVGSFDTIMEYRIQKRHSGYKDLIQSEMKGYRSNTKIESGN